MALIYSGVVPSTPTTVQPIAVSPTSDPTQVSLTLANTLVIDQHIYSFISAQSGPLALDHDVAGALSWTTVASSSISISPDRTTM